MKLELAAITASQGVERGIREASPQLDELSALVDSLPTLKAQQRFLLVSLVDQPVGHFENVSSRKAVLQLEVGYDPAVFRFPLNQLRILDHLAERACFAVSSSSLCVEDRQAIVAAIQSWHAARRSAGT